MTEAEAAAHYALETFYMLGATDALRMLVLFAPEHGVLLNTMADLYDEGIGRLGELAEERAP